MFFKLILQKGHMGAGKSATMVRYLKAQTINDVLNTLHYLPSLKGKRRLKGIYSIKSITRQEYEDGLKQLCFQWC